MSTTGTPRRRVPRPSPSMLTESTTNPRRIFEDDALKELADYVDRNISAFCAVDRFVAIGVERRVAAGGPRSDGHKRIITS